MQQTFGNYVVQTDTDLEYLKINFSSTSVPLQQRWRNNGLSADFLADYWMAFFPAHDVPSQQRQVQIKGSISYIANELLENMMKFNDNSTDHPLSLTLYLYGNKFVFYAHNTIEPARVDAFQARIQTLLTEDPEELYIRQVKQNISKTAGSSSSGLGLLTMLHDYDAQLAWAFDTLFGQTEYIVVTTMVQLVV